MDQRTEEQQHVIIQKEKDENKQTICITIDDRWIKYTLNKNNTIDKEYDSMVTKLFAKKHELPDFANDKTVRNGKVHY